MSRKGVVGSLRLNRKYAAIAAAVIEERTEGIDLERTPFAALPAFGRKLRAALKRRRASATEIVMWNLPTVGFGRPVPLAGLPDNMGPTSPLNYDVAPDGSRFVTIIPWAVDDDGASPDQIVIVQNWHEELKRLVPVD